MRYRFFAPTPGMAVTWTIQAASAAFAALALPVTMESGRRVAAFRLAGARLAVLRRGRVDVLSVLRLGIASPVLDTRHADISRVADRTRSVTVEPVAIAAFRHKGLEQFFAAGTKRGIQAKHADRLRLILGRLNVAASPADMSLPGLALHELQGTRKGTWAVKVSGNWRDVHVHRR